MFYFLICVSQYVKSKENFGPQSFHTQYTVVICSRFFLFYKARINCMFSVHFTFYFNAILNTLSCLFWRYLKKIQNSIYYLLCDIHIKMSKDSKQQSDARVLNDLCRNSVKLLLNVKLFVVQQILNNIFIKC